MTHAEAVTTAKMLRLSSRMREQLHLASHDPGGFSFISDSRTKAALIKRKLVGLTFANSISVRVTTTGRELAAGLAGKVVT